MEEIVDDDDEVIELGVVVGVRVTNEGGAVEVDEVVDEVVDDVVEVVDAVEEVIIDVENPVEVGLGVDVVEGELDEGADGAVLVVDAVVITAVSGMDEVVDAIEEEAGG